jgi:hypothetical protein
MTSARIRPVQWHKVSGAGLKSPSSVHFLLVDDWYDEYEDCEKMICGARKRGQGDFIPVLTEPRVCQSCLRQAARFESQAQGQVCVLEDGRPLFDQAAGDFVLSPGPYATTLERPALAAFTIGPRLRLSALAF